MTFNIYTQAIRFGAFYWILGGDNIISCPNDDGTLFDSETYFWSLKKERWINGPNLPLLSYNEKDAVLGCIAVNSTTAYIFSMAASQPFTYSFNVKKNIWMKHESPKSVLFHNIQSSTVHDSKSNERLVLSSFMIYCTVIESYLIQYFKILLYEQTYNS